MEGLSHEAIGLAGKQRLSRLIVMWDDNGISIDGKVALVRRDGPDEPLRGGGVVGARLQRHDPEDVNRVLEEAKATPQPAMIACRSHIGYGAPTKQDTKAAHGSPLGADEIAAVREAYGWPHPPFVIPNEVAAAWRAIGERGRAARAEWEARLARLAPGKRAEFERVISGEMPGKLGPALARFRKESRGEGAQGRHPEVVGDGARGGQRRRAGDPRGLGRPYRIEQHPDQGPRGLRAGEPRRALHPLRHPRARHGGGDERHRGARRAGALRRHVPRLQRLHARARCGSRR